jgi:hypothetical protein
MKAGNKLTIKGKINTELNLDEKSLGHLKDKPDDKQWCKFIMRLFLTPLSRNRYIVCHVKREKFTC